MLVALMQRCPRCASAMLGTPPMHDQDLCLICREIEREAREASHSLQVRRLQQRNRIDALRRTRPQKARLPA